MARIPDAAIWPPRDLLIQVIPVGMVVSLCYAILVSLIKIQKLQHASVKGNTVNSNALGLSGLENVQIPTDPSKPTLEHLDGVAVLSFRILRLTAVVALIVLQFVQIFKAFGGNLDHALLINYVSSAIKL